MKVISLLNYLNPKEEKSFLNYLKSPYFNTDETLIELAEYLINQKDLESISKKHIWQKLYGNKAFSDNHLRQLLHKLMKHLKSFISFNVLKNQEVLMNRTLSSYARANNIVELKTDLEKYADQFYSEKEFYKSSDLVDLLVIQDSVFHMGSEIDRINNYQNRHTQNILKRQKELLLSFSSLFLRGLYLLENNHQSVSNTEMLLLEDQIDQLDSLTSSNDNIPIHKLYWMAYQLYVNNDGHNQIKEVLDFLPLFEKEITDEIKILYIYIKNFLTRERNKGKEVDQEFFDLMQYGLSSGIELSQRKIDIIAFNNVVILACRLNKIEEAFEIIETYSIHLDQKIRMSVKSYCLARVHFAAKQFDQAVRELAKVNYDTTGININAKMLQITSFYELEENDVVISTIKAFKVFLRRSRKMSKTRKQNFMDFCDVVYNLVQATEKSDPKRITKAQAIIESNPAIPSSSWLKEKITAASDLLGISDKKETEST